MSTGRSFHHARPRVPLLEPLPERLEDPCGLLVGPAESGVKRVEDENARRPVDGRCRRREGDEQEKKEDDRDAVVHEDHGWG